ncbi:MAG: DUF262 domain-containing protein [Nitrospirae bacterium]|nr:DUF262 domain-containing protein [Nitrospirota bacterium]
MPDQPVSANDDKVIEGDEDTKKEDSYSSGLYPRSITKADIDIGEDKFSVFEFLRKMKQKKIEMDPEFQRNEVWNNKQRSRFIESILMNIPLPPLYLNQDISGNYIVVDGLQRLSTIRDFCPETVEGFRLTDLVALPELNGKSFNQLSSELQSKIEDKMIHVFVIKPSVPILMVYDIFSRINTGGSPLSRQEIRNCLFIGKATRLLKALAEDETFMQAIDYGIAPTRMKDREAALRCLAFKILDYEKEYDNDMDKFLGNALDKINKMSNNEIEELKGDFIRVMTRTFELYQYGNFRIPTDSTRGRINIAVMESVCHFFSAQTDEFIKANKKRLIKNYKSLLEDEDYLDAVSVSTGDKRRVNARFRLSREILGNVT